MLLISESQLYPWFKVSNFSFSTGELMMLIMVAYAFPTCASNISMACSLPATSFFYK